MDQTLLGAGILLQFLLQIVAVLLIVLADVLEDAGFPVKAISIVSVGSPADVRQIAAGVQTGTDAFGVLTVLLQFPLDLHLVAPCLLNGLHDLSLVLVHNRGGRQPGDLNGLVGIDHRCAVPVIGKERGGIAAAGGSTAGRVSAVVAAAGHSDRSRQCCNQSHAEKPFAFHENPP